MKLIGIGNPTCTPVVTSTVKNGVSGGSGNRQKSKASRHNLEKAAPPNGAAEAAGTASLDTRGSARLGPPSVPAVT